MTILDTSDHREQVGAVFAQAVARFRPDPLVLGHFDADGLAAAATLERSLIAAGSKASSRIVGKGENPWDQEMRVELEARSPGALLVADLGVREGAVLPDTPTVIVDHHVPTGTPGFATVISGHGWTPEPTSALLAYWCARGIGDADNLLWLAALGLIGDMAEESAFPEMKDAQQRYGKTSLRSAVTLINAPRRSSRADASPALRLLLKCNSPKELLSGDHPETAELVAAREEVRVAMEGAKRVAPRIRGNVALLTLSSPCQIHPLIAQQWRSRLRDKVVIAANRSYRPGWVHFAARTGSGQDLISFFAKHRPEGAGSEYGSGASPGERWRTSIRTLEPLYRGTGLSRGADRMTNPSRPLRLGFPVKVIGRPDLRSNDTRRWQKNPHLKCSLEHVDRIFDYLQAVEIDMYRFSSDLAPYATHPDMPQFHNMVAESDAELRAIGAKARELDLRLSFHPSQYVLLNSPDPKLTSKSIWDFASQAEMLDRMGCGPEAVMVTHVGGLYDDKDASRARWIKGWEQCPDFVRDRLVLENDDIRFSAADVLWIHERTGVRLIFDYQHFWCLNPERLEMRDTLERFLATWPLGIRPKIHFSSPRTEMREVKRQITPKQREAAKAGKRPNSGELTKAPVKAAARTKTVLLPPIWTGHSDFTNPFEFATFMRMAKGLEFDVMMEGKSKDVSIIKLRPDLLRFAPDVAERFGICAGDAEHLAADERLLESGVAAKDDFDVDEGNASLTPAQVTA